VTLFDRAVLAERVMAGDRHLLAVLAERAKTS
jgi:hypothetical protein